MAQKTFDTTLEKIKSRGYWKVEIYPAKYKEDVTPLMSIFSLIKETSVQFRGWDCPHAIEHAMEDRFDGYAIDGNRYEAWIDWTYHKEIWRAYTSGKFIHLFSINEQWLDDYDESWGKSQWADREDLHTASDVIGVIYKVTEILEFAERFMKKLDQEEYVFKISLQNVESNKLVILEPGRSGLWGDYINRSKTINAFDGKILSSSIADKDARFDLGRNIIQKIFNHFNWEASDGLIRAEQIKLVERKL